MPLFSHRKVHPPALAKKKVIDELQRSFDKLGEEKTFDDLKLQIKKEEEKTKVADLPVPEVPETPANTPELKDDNKPVEGLPSFLIKVPLFSTKMEEEKKDEKVVEEIKCQDLDLTLYEFEAAEFIIPIKVDKFKKLELIYNKPVILSHPILAETNEHYVKVIIGNMINRRADFILRAYYIC